MKRGISITLGTIFVLIVMFYAWQSATQTMIPSPQKQVEQTTPAQTGQVAPQDHNGKSKPGEQLSWWGKAFALFVLLITLGAVVYQVVNTEGSWTNASLSPVAVALIAVLLLNVLAALGIPKWWLKFWNEHMLFLLANVGVILAVHFYNKPSNASKAVAVAIILVVMASAFNTYSTDGVKMPGSGLFNQATNTDPSYGVPADIALPIIAECESGSKQFDSDGKLIWNKEGSTAVGKYQIIASMHEERAKKMGFDIRTEKGNEGYAKTLYAESGTKHWEVDPRSKACWGPKLAVLGLSQGEVILTMEAPVEDFGSEVTIPSGIYFDWGNSTDPFVVQDQKGSLAKYDPESGVQENLPYPTKKLFFKSSKDKPAIVKLKLSKTPLVKM